MRSVSRPDIVVAHHADRPVRLEHGEHHVLDVRHAVLAQGLPQLVVRDARPLAVLLEDLPVVDEHDALAREQLGDASAPDAPPVDHPVPSDQHTGCYESARQTRVGSHHRVLDRVRDDEQQHQVERGHLAELTGAGESQPVEQGVPRSGQGCLKYEPSPCVPSDPKCRSIDGTEPSTDGHHRRETPHAARSGRGPIVAASRETTRFEQAPSRPRSGRRGLVFLGVRATYRFEGGLMRLTFHLAAAVAAALTVTTVAAAQKAMTGNGAPSGSHYNLNIIGVSHDKNPNMNGNGSGNVIFVDLGSKTGDAVTTKILLSQAADGVFDVLDK